MVSASVLISISAKRVFPSDPSVQSSLNVSAIAVEVIPSSSRSAAGQFMSKFLFRRGSLIGKFLAADGCIIHEAAFSNGKNGHALLILACGGCVLLAAARARGRTPGAGARRGA